MYHAVNNKKKSAYVHRGYRLCLHISHSFSLFVRLPNTFKYFTIPFFPFTYLLTTSPYCGPGSSVGITTDYGLDGPGIESRWGRNFLLVQTGPGAHLVSCTMGTGSFPRVKCGRGVMLTTHLFLVPLSWKSRAIPLPNI